MTSPQNEEEGVLREWAPLSKFLFQIPLRAWQGIFLENINFTCVAADVDCIALGTSSGHVFWYNRATHDVHQLRPEKSVSPVTSVAVVSSVEFMVAAGDELGVITIFSVPKDLPTWLAAEPREKQKLEVYSINEPHSRKITALTWSCNGQKLFSGDESGLVVFTEVDHRMSITRACEVVNEKFKIVQLSYNQHQQALVVATELRCIVCSYKKPSWQITQVGQRERNSLQELGSTFAVDCDQEFQPPSIFSCRAGLRLWKSNLQGNVEHTIKFKGVFESANKPVKLLRPLPPAKGATNQTLEFGKLYPWRDGLLVSHWQNTLTVFDPSTIRVVATINHCDATLTAATTTQKEIFIIMGHRELVRLSYFPDCYDSSLGGIGSMASGEPVSVIPTFSFNPINGLPLVTSPTQNSRVKLTARTANSEPTANEVCYGVDTAQLVSSTAASSVGVPELRLDSSRHSQFFSIGQEEFDEILFVEHKKKKSKRNRAVTYDSNRNSGEFYSEENASESGSSLAESMLEVTCEQEEAATILEVSDTRLLPPHLLPDNRPLEEIVEDFKMKEELLESSIVYPPPLNDLSPPYDTNNTIADDGKHNEPTLNCVESDVITDITSESQENGTSDSVKPASELREDFLSSCVDVETGQACSEELLSLETSELSSTSGETCVIIGEDVTDCTNLPVVEDKSLGMTDAALTTPEPAPPCELENARITFPFHQQDLFNGWTETSCPDHPSCISTFNEGVVMCSPTFKSFVCESTNWVKLPYDASQIHISPDGQVGVKIHCSSAYYSRYWRSKDQWKLLSRNVDSVHVLNDKLWFVSQGELYFMLYCSELVDKIPSSHKLAKIYGDSDSLLGIDNEHRLLTLKGDGWLPVWSFQAKVKQFCYGPNKLYWVVDFDDRIFVTDDLKGIQNQWWQVIVADFKAHDQLSIAANETGIYVANAQSKAIAVNCTLVSALNWVVSGVKVDCVQISAEGVFEEKGSVWVLCKGNRLIRIPSTLDSIHHVKAPCKVVCLASRPQALWLLSEDGDIYIKQDTARDNSPGVDWKKMDSEQLRGKQLQISHLSCGFDVVWACDIRGNILMLVGSLRTLSNCSYTPAWVLVEGAAVQNNTFTKVYVGPHCHMVWALDNAGNVYVREAICPDLPVGMSWVHVPGLKASHLSISSETVWALGHCGIYKRTGISESNLIGEMWVRVDGVSNYMSVSVDEKLLTVENSRIRSYTETVFRFTDDIVVETDWTLL